MSSFVLIDKIWILMIVLVLFFTIPVVIFAKVLFIVILLLNPIVFGILSLLLSV